MTFQTTTKGLEAKTEDWSMMGGFVRRSFVDAAKNLTIDIYHEGRKEILRTEINPVTGKENCETIPYSEAGFKNRRNILAARNFAR